MQASTQKDSMNGNSNEDVYLMRGSFEPTSMSRDTPNMYSGDDNSDLDKYFDTSTDFASNGLPSGEMGEMYQFANGLTSGGMEPDCGITMQGYPSEDTIPPTLLNQNQLQQLQLLQDSHFTFPPEQQVDPNPSHRTTSISRWTPIFEWLPELPR